MTDFSPVRVREVTLTEVMVSAEATMSARPALMMWSSRSFSMGSIPLGTLSIRENIRCNSDGDRGNGVIPGSTFGRVMR